MSRTIYGNALIGCVLGLLVFLPRGIESLHALENQGAPAAAEQARDLPLWVRRVRNLKFWRVRVSPSYRQELAFDDNVFLNDRGEGRGREADLIITERPGASLQFNYKKVNVNLSYAGEIRQYVRHPELNTRTFAGDMKLDIDLGLDKELLRIQQQKGRFFFKVTDDLKGRTDPVDLADPTLVARLNNRLQLKTGLEFKKGEIYLKYDNNYLHVFTGEFKRIQHMAHSLSLGAKYQVTPRWTGELFVRPGLIDFDEGTLSDQQFVEVVAVARGELSRTLTANLSVGYRHQEVLRRGDEGDDSDFDGMIFNASLAWDLSRRTRMFISARRDVQLSSISNFKVATIGRLSVVHDFLPERLRGSLQLEVNHQESSSGPTGGEPTNTRYLVKLKLDYKFRSWLVFDISYQYQQNESDTDDGEFYQNLLTFGASLTF